MPPIPKTVPGPVLLICGEDEFAVKQRARQVYQQWCQTVGGMDHEVIDASVASPNEAFKAIARLREALQTLPFFGSAKVIWFKDCNFLGDERPAASAAVTQAVGQLAEELKAFRWDNVCLLLSAGKVDRRRTFFKTFEKLGAVEALAGLSPDDKDWADQAEIYVRQELRARQKEISEEALGELVDGVGPHLRQLSNEIEKLTLYTGARPEITVQDVLAVASRHKHARAFAVGDALGDRDLPRMLRCLDEELWEMKTDKDRTEIGLLYGIISKVRVLLLLKELVTTGLLKPETEFGRFKAQLERLPAHDLPADKRYNPLALNPYVLFKALPQVGRYSQQELVRAMDLLLACNQKLVSSGLDEALVLQQTLVEIVGAPGPKGSRVPANNQGTLRPRR